MMAESTKRRATGFISLQNCDDLLSKFEGSGHGEHLASLVRRTVFYRSNV
jgi:hypothetical protein